MPDRDPDLSAAEELLDARHALEVVEALAHAADHAHEVLDIVLDASDPPSAAEELQRRYQLSEVQALAVLNLQFRRVTEVDRARLVERADGLRRRVHELEDEATRS